MKKIIALIVIVFIFKSNFAQLETIPAIQSTIYNSSKIQGLNILLNTKDFTRAVAPNQHVKYPTSVQMIHVAQPFPPIWYLTGKLTDSMTFNPSDFLLDFNIQKKSNQVTFGAAFFDQNTPILTGYFTFDTATITLVDSTLDGSYHLDSARTVVDLHDIRYNSNGEKMIMANVNRTIDGRCLSNNPADSLMRAVVSYIVILDANNHPVFVWDPLQHMSPCEMYYQYRFSSTLYGPFLNWSHGNSVRWANDGNILYNFRHIGCGKINRQTGDIMFKLGGKDTAAIPLADEDRYYLQHDFYQTENGLYSIFSNGDSAHPYMRSILYKIDEVAKKASVVYTYQPSPKCNSLALGSADYINGLCIVDRGLFVCSNVNVTEIVDTTDNSKVAELFGPQYQFSYQSRGTFWNVSHRPNIKLEAGELKTDSIADLYNYKWYKVDDTSATLVGNGLTFHPSNGKYVVQAQKDTGLVISHLVSDVINVVLTNTKNNISSKTNITFLGDNNSLKIDHVDENGMLQITNLNGQTILKQTISKEEIISLKYPSGIYIVNYFNTSFSISKKIFIN